jgi:hypothetical protein
MMKKGMDAISTTTERVRLGEGAMEREMKMLDLLEPNSVEISISADKTKLWVNVDGICRLRIQEIETEIMIDHNDG